jgi:site-specific DNA-methyltransferase (adenine-specific)
MGPRLENFGDGWPLDKSLCLIPELFRFALAYGFNPLTGRQTDRWRIRNVVRWVRPNPPVGALADKFRPATSDLVIACKDRKRYFDLDAVREASDYHREGSENYNQKDRPGQTRRGTLHTVNSNGSPPLDWWSIPPGGFPGSHYAVFPPELCVRPIKAMCPERVCTVCGQPCARIVERESANVRTLKHRGATGAKSTDVPDYAERATIGWTDCGHDSWRRGVVLDCFGGTGTTGIVAVGHGRNAVLIDLDERNAELARERLGMFLDVATYDPNGSHVPEWLVSPQTLGGAQSSA